MATELLDRHLACENAHDLDGIMQTYEDDPEIVLNGKRIAGEAAVREFHRSMGFSEAGSFSDLHVAERHRYRAADAIIIEQTLTGAHTGAWLGLAATRRRFSVDVCTIYKLGPTGKLAGEYVYLDFAWLRRQLEG